MKNIITLLLLCGLLASCRSLRPAPVTAADYAFDAQLKESRKNERTRPSNARAGTRHNTVKALTVKGS